MIAEVIEAQKEFKRAIKKVGGSRNIPVNEREACFDSLAGTETAEQCVQRRIKSFIKDTGCTEVTCDGLVNLSRLVSNYFESIAPFELNKAKKNEFPDALALQSLENYAKSEGTMCIAVSQDDGWKNFCETSEWLVCEATLADAISHFQRVPSVVAANFAERIDEGVPTELSNAIEAELEHVVESMGWFAEASAGHFYEPEPEESKFLGFGFSLPTRLLVVGQNEDEERTDFQATLEVDVEASCGFTFFINDEGDQIPFASSYNVVSNTMIFEIAFSVYGDNEGDFDVDHVEVLSHETTIFFGDVEPDFREPEDY